MTGLFAQLVRHWGGLRFFCFCCGKGLVVCVELGSCVCDSALGPSKNLKPISCLWFFLGSFLSEFGFRSFLFGFCASFLFTRWRQGKCLGEFACLIFLFGFVRLAQFFVWLSQFFVSVSAAVGTIFWWACGTFVLFGFCLFEKNC